MKYQERFLTIWDTPTASADTPARVSRFKRLVMALLAR